MTRLFILTFSILCSNVSLAALHIRDLDGNWSNGHEGVYDDMLDITWLADANYAQTSGFSVDGLLTWSEGLDWAANLEIGGFTNWRLPEINPLAGTSYNYTYAADGTSDYGYNVSAPETLYSGSTENEMAHLFHNSLGNLGYCDPVLSIGSTCSVEQNSWGLMSTSIFENVQAFFYWSGSEAVNFPNPTNDVAWNFHLNSGSANPDSMGNKLYVWAVTDGDIGIAVVPLPAASWLLFSALAGLLGIKHKSI